jgi:hypothetical protein
MECCQIGKPFISKGYRVDYGNPAPARATAADVVKFERDELGNDNYISARDLKALANFNNRDIVWVTKTKKEAREYRSEGDKTAVSEIDFEGKGREVGHDDFGGYLVLTCLIKCTGVKKR